MPKTTEFRLPNSNSFSKGNVISLELHVRSSCSIPQMVVAVQWLALERLRLRVQAITWGHEEVSGGAGTEAHVLLTPNCGFLLLCRTGVQPPAGCRRSTGLEGACVRGRHTGSSAPFQTAQGSPPVRWLSREPQHNARLLPWESETNPRLEM